MYPGFSYRYSSNAIHMTSSFWLSSVKLLGCISLYLRKCLCNSWMEIWQKKSLPYMIAFLFKIVLYFIVWYLILSKNTLIFCLLSVGRCWQLIQIEIASHLYCSRRTIPYETLFSIWACRSEFKCLPSKSLVVSS